MSDSFDERGQRPSGAYHPIHCVKLVRAESVARSTLLNPGNNNNKPGGNMVNGKKYELLPTRHFTPEGKPLWQLRALRDFARVKAGDLGGLIEGEHNLPHDGLAWVHAGAILYGDGYVSDGTPIIPVAVRPVKPVRPPRAPSFRPRTRPVFW